MEKVSNISEAKKLIETYNNLSENDFFMPTSYKNTYIDQLRKITGFGSPYDCSLCFLILYGVATCDLCIYNQVGEYDLYKCTEHDTYGNINYSKTLDELLIACKERAKYIQSIIDKIESKNEQL